MYGRYYFQVNSNLFICCVCLEVFKIKENLVFKINVSGRNYFVCKVCYYGSKLLYYCEICRDSFLNFLQLEVYVVIYYGRK